MSSNKCTNPTCAALKHDCPNCVQRNKEQIMPVPITEPNPPHINNKKCKCVICNPEKKELLTKSQYHELSNLADKFFDGIPSQEKGGKKSLSQQVVEDMKKLIPILQDQAIREACRPELEELKGLLAPTPQPESEGVEDWEDKIVNTVIAESMGKDLSLADILSKECLERLLCIIRNQAEQIRMEERERAFSILHTVAMKTKVTEALDLIEEAQATILNFKNNGN